MKKTAILFGVIFLISLFTEAQEYKGKFFLGGALGYYQNSDDRSNDNQLYKNESKSFSLNIPTGYFVSNHIMVGLITGFDNYSTEYEQTFDGNSYTETSKNPLFFIGPFVRGYKSISDKLDFFLDFSTAFGVGKGTRTYDYKHKQHSEEDYEGKTTSYAVGLSPGVSLKLSKWLFMDLRIGMLGYNYENYKPDDTSGNDSEETYKNFGFNFNYINFGLSSKIGK